MYVLHTCYVLIKSAHTIYYGYIPYIMGHTIYYTIYYGYVYYMYTCIHVYMCVYVCIHTYIYTCIHIHMSRHHYALFLCVYMYVYIHTYTHVYIYTCIHVYIHTYTHKEIMHNGGEDSAESLSHKKRTKKKKKGILVARTALRVSDISTYAHHT